MINRQEPLALRGDSPTLRPYTVRVSPPDMAPDIAPDMAPDVEHKGSDTQPAQTAALLSPPPRLRRARHEFFAPEIVGASALMGDLRSEQPAAGLAASGPACAHARETCFVLARRIRRAINARKLATVQRKLGLLMGEGLVLNAWEVDALLRQVLEHAVMRGPQDCVLAVAQTILDARQSVLDLDRKTALFKGERTGAHAPAPAAAATLARRALAGNRLDSVCAMLSAILECGLGPADKTAMLDVLGVSLKGVDAMLGRVAEDRPWAEPMRQRIAGGMRCLDLMGSPSARVQAVTADAALRQRCREADLCAVSMAFVAGRSLLLCSAAQAIGEFDQMRAPAGLREAFEVEDRPFCYSLEPGLVERA